MKTTNLSALGENLRRDMTPEDLVREANRIQDAIERVRIRKARENVNDFIEYVFGVVQGDIHREWHDLMDDESSLRTLIIAPRNHGKTTQIKGRCIWLIGHNPNIRIKYVMMADDKAAGIVGNVGNIITENERVRKVFPDLLPSRKDKWTTRQLFVRRRIESPDATLEAAGNLCSAVSGRSDLLVFDDVVAPRNAVLQPSLQKQVKYQYANAWLPTLEENSPIIYLATPWTDTDLTSSIQKMEGWKKWIRPAIYNGEAIWPEKWSLSALEQRRQDMMIEAHGSDRAFRQQYLLEMVTAGERVFDLDSIDNCKRYDIYLGEAINPNWPKFMGVDLARTEGGGNYTVVFTIAIDDAGRRWVVDIAREQIRASEIPRLIAEKYEMYHPQIVMVENNAFQQVVIDQLSELDISIPVQGHYTGTAKHDISMGVPSLATQIDNGSWVIPFAGDHGDVVHNCPVCAWIDEMLSYPFGEHNDTVMAMWLADIAARGGKFSRAEFNSWYDLPRTDAAIDAAVKAMAHNGIH